MRTIEIFNSHVEEYERWFDLYPHVFQSEMEAVREMMPVGTNLHGIEVGTGTGRYAEALKVKEGVEPAYEMRRMAQKRGIETMDAVAEILPYADLRFDFVVMVTICYFRNIRQAFREANRVLKHDGSLVVGFVDRNSTIGREYQASRKHSQFYKNAVFYSADKVANELTKAGFKHLTFCQTLFGNLDDINETQHSKDGYGEGSFVVIKASKTWKKL